MYLTVTHTKHFLIRYICFQNLPICQVFCKGYHLEESAPENFCSSLNRAGSLFSVWVYTAVTQVSFWAFSTGSPDSRPHVCICLLGLRPHFWWGHPLVASQYREFGRWLFFCLWDIAYLKMALSANLIGNLAGCKIWVWRVSKLLQPTFLQVNNYKIWTKIGRGQDPEPGTHFGSGNFCEERRHRPSFAHFHSIVP